MTDDARTVAERLAEIESRLAAATPGPWRAYGLPYKEFGDDPVVVSGDNELYICQTAYDSLSGSVKHAVDADTRLIAAAPDDLRWLIARVKALEAEVARLRKERGTLSAGN